MSGNVYMTVSNCCGTNCCVCVPQDQLAVYEMCGAYKGQLQPGCQFLGCDVCSYCLTTRAISTRVMENTTVCETKTSDNVFVRVDVAVQQQPMTNKVNDAIYKLRNPLAQIDSYVGDVVRAQVPQMTLDEVFSNKDAIAAAVKDKIDDKMEEFGWRILQCLVVNVDPDQGVKNAMNAIESARRHKDAAETKAEADKFVLIRNASAEAESKALQGQGIARQRAAIVQGLRDSIGAAEAMDPERVSELLLITQYFDTLEKMATNKGQVIFVPHNGGGSDVSSQIRDGVLQASASAGSKK